jgi:hypothetical protein
VEFFPDLFDSRSEIMLSNLVFYERNDNIKEEIAGYMDQTADVWI